MLAQRLDCVIGAGKFGFGQRGVDFTMANLMQQNGRPAFSAPELRDKVVQALGHVRRDRATAEWTVGCFAHG